MAHETCLIDMYGTLTITGHTNEGGERESYPAIHIDLDGRCVAIEFAKYDLTPTMVEDIFFNAKHEISHAINKAIASRISQMVLETSARSVRAEVDFEIDNHVCCETFDTSRFDCAVVLDDYKLSELPPDADGFADGFCNFGDDIYYDAISYGLVDDWTGPFTFRIVDYDAYDRYIAERVRSEYGYELRGWDLYDEAREQGLI